MGAAALLQQSDAWLSLPAAKHTAVQALSRYLSGNTGRYVIEHGLLYHVLRLGARPIDYAH